MLVYQIGTHDTRVLVDVSEQANVTDALEYMREVCLLDLFETLCASLVSRVIPEW